MPNPAFERTRFARRSSRTFGTCLSIDDEALSLRRERMERWIPGRMGGQGPKGRGVRILRLHCAGPPCRDLRPHAGADARCGSDEAASRWDQRAQQRLPVAREAATADLLTDGRLQVGLGAGHMKSEYDEAGLRFDAGRARV